MPDSNLSCNSDWKWLWREQRYHEKMTNWYNTLFYNNARMCQPWLKAIFHHSWRPASSVLFQDKIWDTFERSGVIKCHFGRIKQCKCMVGFHIVTLEDDGIFFTCSTCSTPKNWHLTNNHVGKWWIPHRKLTGQRKITFFFKGDTSSIKRLFVRCHVGFPGVFHWWIFSVIFPVMKLPGHWRKWSYHPWFIQKRCWQLPKDVPRLSNLQTVFKGVGFDFG